MLIYICTHTYTRLIYYSDNAKLLNNFDTKYFELSNHFRRCSAQHTLYKANSFQ